MERRHFLNTVALAGLAPLLNRIARAVSLAVPGVRQRLNCRWQERKHGSYICDLNQSGRGPFHFTELLINGQPQILARYPDAQPSGLANYVTAIRFLPPGSILPDFQNATKGQDLLAIEFDPATFTTRRWGNPDEASLCLKTGKGDLRFPIRAIDYDQNLIWFAGDGSTKFLDLYSAPQFYVENVFEELNAPGEWYLDRHQGYLFYRPPDTVDMSTAIVDVASAN